jgi:hypothetical protein
MNKKIISLLLLFVISAMFCFGQTISSPEELKKYLSSQPKNEADNPIKVTMSAEESMLFKINEVITQSGKFVSLNLTGNLYIITFGSCKKLVSITLPSGVTTIAKSAFMGCTELTSINLPNTVTSIETLAFYGCTELASITIPNKVTSIGDSIFSGCKSLASVTIPNSVTSIGSNAFKDCISLKNITIPNSVTSIGDNAFYGCTSLTSITMPNAVTEIKNATFRNCTSLASFTIPNTVTKIGDWAFMNCTSLKNITIPRNVAIIGANAFNSCTSFTNITVPKNVTVVGNDAFSKCTNLTSLTLEGTYNKGIVSADFDKVFWKNGRQSGTYTRTSAKSTTWTNTTPPSFPAGFIGKWNRINTNYMITFEKSRFTLAGAGNQNPSWVLSSVSGDSYVIVPESNPTFTPRINIKIVNRNLEFIAEDVTGVDRIIDWNGKWEKQ